MAVATKPATLYNPLFIYGNSGLGKTHLLNAIGNYVSEHAPDKKVYYTTSEDFVNAVVNSIKNRQIQEFKEEMNDLDVPVGRRYPVSGPARKRVMKRSSTSSTNSLTTRSRSA